MQTFAPDMNWLRLWAANGNDDGDALTETLEDPDMLTDEGRFQVINIGCVRAERCGALGRKRGSERRAQRRRPAASMHSTWQRLHRGRGACCAAR